MIIAGRAIQGVGGGGIIILANISVSDLFSMRYGLHLYILRHNGRYNANIFTEIGLCITVSLVLLGPSLVLWDLSSEVLLPRMLHGGGVSG